MAMPHYRLIYFNMRARGEFIRLMFAAAGVEYEDVRIERDQWTSQKSTMPFLQVPVLEVDGVRLCQSSAIGRYLAEKYGLDGKTDLDRARAHMIVECLVDTMGTTFRECVFAKDDATKNEVRESFAKERLPTSLAALETILIENKGGDGYFVGDQLTWADIRLLQVYDQLTTLQVEFVVANYPKLHALVQRVTNLPRIKEWLAKRPQTAL